MLDDAMRERGRHGDALLSHGDKSGEGGCEEGEGCWVISDKRL